MYTVFLFTYPQLLASVSFFCSYDAGTLAHIWPLDHVTLSLHGPFLTNVTLAGSMIDDVSYPETPIILKDINLNGVQSVQPFSKAAKRRIRYGHHFYLGKTNILTNWETNKPILLLCCNSSGI